VFTEGSILFFDPFYFQNNNAPKPKYFIVLKIVQDKIILASLPSSVDCVPAFVDTTVSACIEIPEANFNCYLFTAKQSIATNGWAFRKDTFLYGHQLGEYQTDTLKDIYPIEGLDFEIIGTLQQTIFDEIMKCFRNSASVKRKFKKLL
jgi:hypothetical protein